MATPAFAIVCSYDHTRQDTQATADHHDLDVPLATHRASCMTWSTDPLTSFSFNMSPYTIAIRFGRSSSLSFARGQVEYTQIEPILGEP